MRKWISEVISNFGEFSRNFKRPKVDKHLTNMLVKLNQINFGTFNNYLSNTLWKRLSTLRKFEFGALQKWANRAGLKCAAEWDDMYLQEKNGFDTAANEHSKFMCLHFAIPPDFEVNVQGAYFVAFPRCRTTFACRRVTHPCRSLEKTRRIRRMQDSKFCGWEVAQIQQLRKKQKLGQTAARTPPMLSFPTFRVTLNEGPRDGIHSPLSDESRSRGNYRIYTTWQFVPTGFATKMWSLYEECR